MYGVISKDLRKKSNLPPKHEACYRELRYWNTNRNKPNHTKLITVRYKNRYHEEEKITLYNKRGIDIYNYITSIEKDDPYDIEVLTVEDVTNNIDSEMVRKAIITINDMQASPDITDDDIVVWLKNQPKQIQDILFYIESEIKRRVANNGLNELVNSVSDLDI